MLLLLLLLLDGGGGDGASIDVDIGGLFDSELEANG